MIMYYPDDTIVAQSTAKGTAAIHIIRISGEDAIPIADKIFKAKTPLTSISDNNSHFGKIYDGDKLIDEVLINLFHAPHSYTGEDVVEINCHGNQFIADLIMEVLLQHARLANPGEFTQRAFINNKIDLTRAEAVGDLLSASTRYSHKVAIDQLEGKLEYKIKQYLDIITSLRMQLELEIDFPEDYHKSISKNELLDKITLLVNEIEELSDTGRDGRILRNGYKVCLVGKPNVGKSSIFNAFLKSERAIVSPMPGTTRDYLEEALSIDGFLVRFFDTAGLRSSDDQIEKIGIKRSREIINNSDLIVYVIDPDYKNKDLYLDEELPPDIDRLKVINKSDLLSPARIKELNELMFIPCSTISTDGINNLKKNIIKMINIKPDKLDQPCLTNSRQLAAAKTCLSNLMHAKSALNQDYSIEFIAFDLLQASKSLEQITGVITSEDILDKIFSSYCIGK